MPLLKKLRYHFPHLHLLGKGCTLSERTHGSLQGEALSEGDRDNQERLSGIFDKRESVAALWQQQISLH